MLQELRHCVSILLKALRNIEWKFVEDLDGDSEIVVYVRVPYSLQIPTSVCNYAPDWAILLD